VISAALAAERASYTRATSARRAARDRGINANVKQGDGFDRTLAVIACALMLVGTGLFFVDGFRDRISADAAVPLLLARRMLETGALMPADWYYGNGDIWIAGPQLFVLPFVAAWGVVPRALACGNALGLAFLFVSALALARATSARWAIALIAAGLPVALYSHFQREFVVVQLSYGLMAAKLMLTLAAAIASLRAPSARGACIALAAYGVLLAIWTTENPGRPLAYLVIPLGIAIALHRAPAQRAIVLGAATLIAMGAGWLVRQCLLMRLQMVPGLDAFHFTPPDEWMQHARWLAAGMRHLFGVDALGVPPAPLLIGALLAALRAATFPVIGILALRAGREREARTPLAVGALGFLLIAALLVIGNLTVDPVGDRYLMPPWLLAISGAVLAASTLRAWRPIALLLVIAFPLGGVLNAVGIRDADSATDAANLPRPPSIDGAIAVLRDSGLTRGFATHRYANVATVRSGGELELCDVHLQPQPVPARWLNAATCFDPARYANGFFVLLAPDERDAMHASALRAAIGTPSAVREADGYAVWMFRNAGANLAWLAR
jgi:hypothetical protein